MFHAHPYEYFNIFHSFWCINITMIRQLVINFASEDQRRRISARLPLLAPLMENHGLNRGA